MPSKELEAALAQAETRPLDDLTCRLVLASSRLRLIVDLSFWEIDVSLAVAEKEGVTSYRTAAASIIGMAAGGADLGDSGVVASAALAYFDRTYLSDAKGRNTLALDVDVDGAKLRVTRSAYAITYPAGAIDLNADPLGIRGDS